MQTALSVTFISTSLFISETPGLNSFLDVTGHNSHSCCHKCSFRVAPKQSLRNRYPNNTACWTDSAYRRTTIRHIAVRLMKLPKGTVAQQEFDYTPPHCSLASLIYQFELLKERHLFPELRQDSVRTRLSRPLRGCVHRT